MEIEVNKNLKEFNLDQAEEETSSDES